MKMKKRAFISQPMRGLSDEEITENRHKIIDELEKEGYYIIDSLIENFPPNIINGGICYLGQSIILLSTADIIYMAKGWEDARGCKIEHQIAKEYGLKVRYEV